MDPSLLPLLDALLELRNVTRAAKRVGLTQSAASHALARLREQLADPLLVRAGGGMALTPRARELVEPVRRAVQALEAVATDTPAFDPRRARRTFAIATGDYQGMTILPALYKRLAKAAPGVDLRILQLASGIEDLLETEALDLVLSLSSPATRPGLYRQRLFEEPYTCVVRDGHPAQRALTLEAFCALGHVLVAPRGQRGVVDHALAERGASRRVTVVVPGFGVAGHLVAGSDLVLTTPERVARALARTLPLRIVPPPLPVPPAVCWQQWHERTHRDPGHVWLRALVAEVSARA
jgi:DNA-binding transcriptional LysR family regulator